MKKIDNISQKGGDETKNAIKKSNQIMVSTRGETAQFARTSMISEITKSKFTYKKFILINILSFMLPQMLAQRLSQLVTQMVPQIIKTSTFTRRIATASYQV
jgi:hypothetical protein